MVFEATDLPTPKSSAPKENESTEERITLIFITCPFNQRLWPRLTTLVVSFHLSRVFPKIDPDPCFIADSLQNPEHFAKPLYFFLHL
jgi:hypothetical protein